jgi:hypothetical protein
MVDILKIIAHQLPALGTLLLVLMLISIFMDSAIKPELKLRFFRKLYRRKSDRQAGLIAEIPLYYAVISSLVGLPSIRKLIVRSIIITILMLALLTALQANLRNEEFTTKTLPFIDGIVDFDLHIWLMLLGVVIIDLISIYQTLTFIRISRGCRNVLELGFVATADILLSLILFITIFPIFAAIAVMSNIPSANTFYALISATPTLQDRSLIERLQSFLVFNPLKDPDLVPKAEIDRLAGRRWHFRQYNLAYLSSAEKDLTLARAITEAQRAGSLASQTRGNLTDQEVFDVFHKFFQKDRTIKSVEVIDTHETLVAAYILLKIETSNSIQYRRILQTYVSVMKELNFLDENLANVLALKSTNITGNTIAFQYAVVEARNRALNSNQDKYIYCDGRYEVIKC